MSSRQQEKERRRQERLAAERAANRAAARRRMVRIGGGAGLALAALVAIGVVALAGGDEQSGGTPSALAADAKAAGCRFTQHRSEGRDHTDGKVRYGTNPPTSGAHNPTPAPDGGYAPGNEPDSENAVHSPEHGRVIFQYKPGSPAADVARLRQLAEEPLNDTAAYHTLLFRNNTDMPAQYAATAWTRSLTCDRLSPQALDVMRDFRRQFTDKAPEFIP